jgi:hypothetical protein
MEAAMSNDPLIEHAIDLAWSHWTAIGVSGVVPPTTAAVDPEALIPLTAALDEYDARLHDEALDWCVQFGARYISTARLRNVLRRFDDDTRRSFAGFAAIVNAHGGARWPTDAAARPFRPSGKSRLESLDHPARSLLRLRVAFGTTARAEILLALLTDRSGSVWTPTARFADLGYGRRNVAAILDDMTAGGLLETKRIANANAYRLRNAAALAALVAPLPDHSSDWHIRLPIVAAAVHLAKRMSRKSLTIRAMEAARFAESYRASSEPLDLPPLAIGKPDMIWERFSRWVADSVACDAPPTRSSARSG